MAESLAHRALAPPADAMSAVRVAFPRAEADFEADTRVSYDMANKKWILEEDDGKEFEWVAETQKWIESVRLHPHPRLRHSLQQAHGLADDRGAHDTPSACIVWGHF